MTVRRFGKGDMEAFRFTDTFVKSADYDAIESHCQDEMHRAIDSERRVKCLEAALRGILAAGWCTPDYDAAVINAMKALGTTTSETACDKAVSPTHQHGPECPILYGYACNCTPIPLGTK